MSTTAQRLIKGSLLNITSLFLGIVISFFMMPYMVKMLGDRMYGVWTIVGEFLWYYGLMDFGLSSAIGRFVSRALGTDDKKEVRIITSTAFYLTVGLGAVCLLLTIILAGLAPLLVKNPDDLKLFRILIILLGINFAFEFPVRVFNSVLGAHLRFDIGMTIAILKNILVAALTVVVLRGGYGVVAISLVAIFGSVLDSLSRIYFATAIDPNLSISRKDFSKFHLPMLFEYSAFTFLGKLADILRFKIDLFVITFYVGLAGVTRYFIAARMMDYFLQLIRSSVEVIGPVFSRDEGRNNFDSIREKYLFVSKLSVTLAVFFGGMGILYGEPFIERWMGPEYTESYRVMVVLMSSGIFALSQNPSDHLLYGISHHRFISIASLIEGVLNLILSLIFVRTYGLLGVALGTAIPMVIRYLIQPIYACRAIQLPVLSYIRTVLRQAGLVTVYMALGYYLTRSNIEPSYPHLILIGILVSALVWPLVFITGFEAQERKVVLSHILGPDYAKD